MPVSRHWKGEASFWNKVIHGCISRLRRSIGATVIETTVGGYRLIAGSADIDALEFEPPPRRDAADGPTPAARPAISADGTTLHLGAGPLGPGVRSVSLLGDDLVPEACRRAGRNLTIDEWNSIVGSDIAYRVTCGAWPRGDR